MWLIGQNKESASHVDSEPDTAFRYLFIYLPSDCQVPGTVLTVAQKEKKPLSNHAGNTVRLN